ncbi:MAG: hypothetical protein RQ750_17315, partial [Roseovarius sp.]|nr:hypothetical protein [Roseovarius sp.]
QSGISDFLQNSGLFSSDGGGGFLGNFLGDLLNFEGGGFTGSGPRSGGVDGRGGMLSVLHPNETVIDHTKSGVGGSVSFPIQVNIQKGAERDSVSRRSGPNGQQIIDIAVSDSISSGRQDGALGDRFGSQPKVVRR